MLVLSFFSSVMRVHELNGSSHIQLILTNLLFLNLFDYPFTISEKPFHIPRRPPHRPAFPSASQTSHFRQTQRHRDTGVGLPPAFRGTCLALGTSRPLREQLPSEINDSEEADGGRVDVGEEKGRASGEGKGDEVEVKEGEN